MPRLAPGVHRWHLLAAVSALLFSACEIENSLDLANPYLTARIILALEQQGVRYRLAKDGVIHYPYEFEDEVETARRQAYRSRGKTSAVIARPAQARLIVEQFDDADIAYRTTKLEHFVLIAWDYPRYRGSESAVDDKATQ